MKKWIAATAMCSLLLSACAPSFGDDNEVVQETDNEEQKAIIPKSNISDSDYKVVLPFKAGAARGLTAENLNTRLDLDKFEIGLMDLAQEPFPSNKDFYYQEGQYLTQDQVSGWLRYKYEGEALKEKQNEAKGQDKEFKNSGLNPVINNLNSTDTPKYLASVLEQNYLKRVDDNTVKLGGVMIGVALNSVHYYKNNDIQKEERLDSSKVRQEGEKIAAEIVKQARQSKELADVPIRVALFQQQPKSSIIPGSFIAQSEAKPGSSNLEGWKDINESYSFFPSPEAKEKRPEDSDTFERLKEDIGEYFPNYTGVIGQARYKEDEMQSLKIEIPMQFYGKAEVVALTQFVNDKMRQYFPQDYIDLEVNITSTDGQEALIVRRAGEETETHIFK
ncbi:CamS family sex pheromone protein [Bacillus mangrovi]|uniref:CamS family sex pheromone protein n=1 Tax=Metabacillus mangrovi TaxID=1491830 RepID=A0A7X2S7F0_9BACI|nr:CamS family sex pheromone protein [Metabacillus mangrovi]MTH54201.1 CamS family sex pheromone protein [Metabacillus mangrovi]